MLKGHAEAVYGIAFTPDGKNVITASFDKTLKVWDAASGKELKTFGGPQGHQGLVLAVAVSPDGQSFASGGADNTARLWDFPGSKPLREFASADAGQRRRPQPRRQDGRRRAARTASSGSGPRPTASSRSS